MISILNADTVLTSSFTDSTGAYTVPGLMAGTYKVMVEDSAYLSQTVEGVQIRAANVTRQDFKLLPDTAK
jgi:hypothetical protein